VTAPHVSVATNQNNSAKTPIDDSISFLAHLLIADKLCLRMYFLCMSRFRDDLFGTPL
jgi:hypothetical protein